MALKFTPEDGWNNNVDFPTEPADEAAARERFQALHNQTRDYINKYLNYVADTASDDSYVVTLDPAPTAYEAGLMIQFKAKTANTGACTLNVNGLGAKTIKKNLDEDLADNDIKAGQVVSVVYDGTNFQMVSPISNVYTHDSIYRQAIINGNFDVWQRGTTATNPSHNTYFAADRWKGFVDGSGFPANIIHSRQALTPGDIPNSYYFYRISPDGTGTIATMVLYRLLQIIENGNRYLCGLNKKITVSFYARSSIANKKIGIYIQQNYGTGGTPTSSEVINGTNWTLTSTWTKYTYTFTTNTLVGKTFGTNNDDNLSLFFGYVWNAIYQSRFGSSATEDFVGSGNIDIAQVQLCAGDVALPFMPKSYEEELSACMRYCEPFGNGLLGRVTNANNVIFAGTYKVKKSTTPSLSLIATNPSIVELGVANRTATGSTLTSYSVNTDGLHFSLSGFSGMSVGNIAVLTSSLVLVETEP